MSFSPQAAAQKMSSYNTPLSRFDCVYLQLVWQVFSFSPFFNRMSSLQLGPYTLANALFVAPMAGVTDRPFRQLCKRLGAGYAVSEMVTSRKDLWESLKTSRRADHAGEPGPIAVQIAGTDAAMMAEAAVFNIQRGAQIIDINMGCPAKKVCNKWAGSALMQNEALAEEIAAPWSPPVPPMACP